MLLLASGGLGGGLAQVGRIPGSVFHLEGVGRIGKE